MTNLLNLLKTTNQIKLNSKNLKNSYQTKINRKEKKLQKKLAITNKKLDKKHKGVISIELCKKRLIKEKKEKIKKTQEFFKNLWEYKN